MSKSFIMVEIVGSSVREMFVRSTYEIVYMMSATGMIRSQRCSLMERMLRMSSDDVTEFVMENRSELPSGRNSRRKHERISNKEQHKAKERASAHVDPERKRQRTAALQDLAGAAACNPPRKRLGVRLSSAALISGLSGFALFLRMSLVQLTHEFG